MAENELQIIVKAVDRVTAELKSMQGSIDKFTKGNKEATQQITSAWNKGTESLIAIGNAAATVDNIFSALTNLQLRLENATIRLTNAQENLADAGTNLSRAQRDLERAQRELTAAEKTRFKDFDRWEQATLNLESAQERVTDAQLAQERATRGLTVAENNLKRTQNQVLGTYINIGVQTLGLIASLPKLGVAFTNVFKFLPGPIGLVAAGLGLVFLAVKDNEELQIVFKELWTELKDLWVEIAPIIETVLVPALKLILGVLAEIIGAVVQLIKDIKTAIEWLGKLGGAGGVSNTVKSGRFVPGGMGVGTAIGMGINAGGTSVGDAIIRPDGTIVHTDPRDTLIAAKDLGTSFGGMNGGGGGVTLIIEGNIYGTDPDEMANALWNKIRKKISI